MGVYGNESFDGLAKDKRGLDQHEKSVSDKDEKTSYVPLTFYKDSDLIYTKCGTDFSTVIFRVHREKGLSYFLSVHPQE